MSLDPSKRIGALQERARKIGWALDTRWQQMHLTYRESIGRLVAHPTKSVHLSQAGFAEVERLLALGEREGGILPPYSS